MTWLKYDYSCRILPSGKCVCDTPNIEVELSHSGKSDKYFGLIDSGCQATHAHTDIAKAFGIDLTKCPTTRVGGVIGDVKDIGYIYTLGMKLKDLGNKFESPIIFVDKLPVPILLGQNNFFEKFDIKFEKRNNTFLLKRNLN